MQLSSAGSTDISRQKFADVQERSLETRVRRRNCGLSRRSEDYDVRILPTARRYYGWVQLPRNPDRWNGSGDGIVHDSRSGEATRPYSRSSFWSVRELAVTFSSPKLYQDPSLFPSLSLSASIVRCMCPPDSCWERLRGSDDALLSAVDSSNAVSTFLSAVFLTVHSYEKIFRSWSWKSRVVRTTSKSYLK